MRILFLYPTPPFSFGGRSFHHGIGILSAVARKRGHATSLCMMDRVDEGLVESRLAELKPDLIALSTTTDQFPLACELVRFLTARGAPPILLGGVHPTAAPEETLSIPGILGAVIGEGEGAFADILDRLQAGAAIDDVQNLGYRRNGEIVRNPLRPLIGDLNSIPFPDREIFEYEKWLPDYRDGLEFIASRGCPYSCSYCIEPHLRELYRGKGPFVRVRSAANLIEEIRQVTARYPRFRILTFHDDIFGIKRDWLREFSAAYARDVGLPYRMNFRADLVDEEAVQLLKQSGCEGIWIGVESGDEKLRQEILDKKVTDDDIRRAFRLAKAAGLKTMAFNMIGLPGETPASVRRTFDLNREIQPDRRGLNIFRPYPGTRLYDLCLEKGWLSTRKVAGYFEESILDQPGISRARLEYYRRLFPLYVTGSPISLMKKVELWTKVLLRNRPGFLGFFRTLKRFFRKITGAPDEEAR
jgi:anaerobic magnesium-protoporphyrin IX monomethyl ester cyclase